MNNDVLTILTSEDRNELKEGIKKLILNQVERDLEDNGCYLIDVDTINSVVDQAIEDMIEELKIEYKEKMREKINKMFEKKFESIIPELNSI